MRLAAIEGGGTTFVLALAEDTPENIIEKDIVYTGEPDETLEKVRQWLNMRKFDAIGIACFGPLIAREGDPRYGLILSSPKPGWKNIDLREKLGLNAEFKDIPYRIDTDVNAPAYAEYRLFKKSGTTSSAFVTVGTGVGVGLVVNGKTINGLVHPEGGHTMVSRMPGDEFDGICIHHEFCLEGVCSTPALADRVGCSVHDLPDLPDDDEVWDICAYYLAQLCQNLILIACPEHISFGGGVTNRKCLLPKIRVLVLKMLNEYMQNPLLTPERIDEFITEAHWFVLFVSVFYF